MSINNYFSTTISAKAVASGTSNFTITVVNQSDKIYVFERIIDGTEVDLEGIYNGQDIGYSIQGMSPLDELPANGGKITFNLTVTNPKGIKTDNFFLKFNFIEKTGTEILPGTDVVKYNVIFNPNNGENTSTISVESGKTVTKPTDPQRDGYIFTGWYKDISLLMLWNFENDTVTSNVTLYAGWSIEEESSEPPVEPGIVQYEVVFKFNNGSPDMSVIVDEGNLIPKPADPTRNGYTFLGWYKDSTNALTWNFENEKITSNITLYAGWKDNNTQNPDDDHLHDDFLGLVEALLSQNTNCLNNNNTIYDSVIESLNSKKRPKDDAPILHCHVNSISGGTMTAVTQQANTKLTQNLHFIFEADPDPAYQSKRMILYMYYETDIDDAVEGQEIMVYKQIVSRGNDGVWFADGTYIGRAEVGDFFGGGNSGKDVWTINPYSWKYGLPNA